MASFGRGHEAEVGGTAVLARCRVGSSPPGERDQLGKLGLQVGGGGGGQLGRRQAVEARVQTGDRSLTGTGTGSVRCLTQLHGEGVRNRGGARGAPGRGDGWR